MKWKGNVAMELQTETTFKIFVKKVKTRVAKACMIAGRESLLSLRTGKTLFCLRFTKESETASFGLTNSTVFSELAI